MNVLQIENWQVLHIRATDASFSLTRWQHSTLMRERTSWLPSWNYDNISKIRHRQLMCIYVANIRAEFHPNQSRNGGALKLLLRNDVTAAILKFWVISEIQLSQSMQIYLKKNHAKFHSEPIWNEGTLVFFEEVAPTTTRTTGWVAIDQFLI